MFAGRRSQALAATAVAFAVYGVSFAPLYAVAGDRAGMLATVPAIVAGWSFGPVGGAAFALVAALTSRALLQLAGDEPAASFGLVVAVIGLVIVAVCVGVMRDLQLRLGREIALGERLLSDKRAAFDEAVAAEQRFRSLIAGNPAVIFSVNAAGDLTFVSENVHELLGTEAENLLGDRALIRSRVHADDLGLLDEQDRLIDAAGYAQLDLRMQRFTGEWIWVRKELRVVRDAAGEPEIIGYFTDITARKRAEEEAARLATIDRTTGLANRAHLDKRLRELVADTSTRVDLALLDVDGLDQVGAAFGADTADAVLRALAARLRGAAGPGELVAHVGKDKFAAVFVRSDIPAVRSATTLLDAFAASFHQGEHEITLTAKIGVASAPDHSDNADGLFRDAEMALYDAKHGHDLVRMYSSDRDKIARAELDLASDLRHAVDRGELLLHFQPIIDLRTRTVTHAEALVRWRHPTRGLVPPAEFIPIAERTGHMKQITRWVVEEALRHCWAWHEEGVEIGVAANLSPRDLADADLIVHIGDALDRYALPPASLSLEITESVVMSDPERALETLTRLRQMGVRLVIDDFGTGYSSLAYLNRLPVDTIKVDRSFVKTLTTDEGAAAIVRATVELAHTLGFSVVAEGAENEEAVTLLGLYGCDGVQGFHFSRPLGHAEFRTWMTKDARDLGMLFASTRTRRAAPSVLVVDDQDVVRMTANILLSRHGFNVLQASSGAEAVALFRDPNNVIDAIISDVIMPEMDGKMLWEQANRLRPRVPVIFMSGHNAASLDLPAGVPFVAKPFTEQALLQVLQDSIGSASAHRSGLN